MTHKNLFRRNVLQHHFIFGELVRDALKLQIIETLLGLLLHVYMIDSVDFRSVVGPDRSQQMMIRDRVSFVEVSARPVHVQCTAVALAFARYSVIVIVAAVLA